MIFHLQNIANSPRKRKLHLEGHDNNESPRKRQNNKSVEKMTEDCENATDSKISKENSKDTGKQAITPPVPFNKGTKKSPRRQLLMKRAGGKYLQVNGFFPKVAPF